MPYIKEERRQELMQALEMKTAGELNYMLTFIALEYLKQHGLSYATINDISGAFTNANAEFYRRVAVPYEDKKIEENGDVYVSGQ